jgi:hypothetical protein
MLFIHQQIQSFLHLGECKEYPIMAKPKSPNPKKNTALNPPISTSSPSLPGNGSAATATAPAMEVNVAPAQSAAAPDKPAPRRTARKPEIVKTKPEARANLVPISIEEEIRQLAYLLSERRGFQSGHETEDWLAAEAEVRQRYHQQSA